MKTQPKVDIIWNTTLLCMWDCAICCVDAVHVKPRGGRLEIRSEGLTIRSAVDRDEQYDSPFDQALALRQEQGLELDLAGKRRVLQHLSGYNVKLDFSGGDPLAISENIIVMREAAQLLGRDNVTLTSTGPGLARHDPREIAPIIGELNFTYDGVPDMGHVTRPRAYASSNLRVARRYGDEGVRLRAECPLSKDHLQPGVLEDIYVALHDAGIEKLLLMRLFNVGRGANHVAVTPTANDYREAIRILRDLEATYTSPRVVLQCALRHLDPPSGMNPCDALRESLGLMADGTLLISPWAIDSHGRPFDPNWVLGNLAEEELHVLLDRVRSNPWYEHLDDNAGHCKIFAFQHGPRDEDAIVRMLGPYDPLYRRTLTG